jgi:hypothetical protein
MTENEVRQKPEKTSILCVGRHETPIAASGSRHRQIPSPDTTLYIDSGAESQHGIRAFSHRTLARENGRSSRRPTREGRPGRIEVQPRPTHADSTIPTLPNRTLLEVIANLLDNLHTEACLQMICRILIMATTFPTGEYCPKFAFKIVFLFLAK